MSKQVIVEGWKTLINYLQIWQFELNIDFSIPLLRTILFVYSFFKKKTLEYLSFACFLMVVGIWLASMNKQAHLQKLPY